MAGKYGSPSVWFLAGGYNLIANKLQELSGKIENMNEPSHGLGDSWEESTPVGVSKGSVVQGGAFFDTTALTGIHAMLGAQGVLTPQSVPRIVCLGFAGMVAGREFYGVQGDQINSYEVLGAIGKLQRANAEHTVTGQVDNGKILHALGAEVADGDTEGALSQDAGASSASGGVGYLQVTALSLGGFDDILVKVRHSADDVTYANLLSFVAVAAAPNAQRVTVAGTVNRHLAVNWDFEGSGSGPSCTFFAGFARN